MDGQILEGPRDGPMASYDDQVPSLPFLLRVGRTPDWGWSLMPVVEGAGGYRDCPSIDEG